MFILRKFIDDKTHVPIEKNKNKATRVMINNNFKNTHTLI